MKRRKDLERSLPKSMRRNGDKTRVYEDASGELFIVIGASFRTESELLGIAHEGLAIQRAAELMAAPAVGGMQ